MGRVDNALLVNLPSCLNTKLLLPCENSGQKISLYFLKAFEKTKIVLLQQRHRRRSCEVQNWVCQSQRTALILQGIRADGK